MSPQTIEMHFAEIMHLAEELHGLVRSMKSLGEQDLMQIMGRNKACHISECEDILAGKEMRLKNRLCAEAEILEKMAEEMESRAKKMYQSEMMNIRLAATRIYR